MPLRTTVTALLLAFLSLTAFASLPPGEPGGTVYGKDVSFAIKAPEGWRLDVSSGLEQGLGMVSYPEGSSWKDSPVVLYISIAGREPATLDAFIADEIGRFRKEHGEGIKVETGKPLPTRDGKKLAEVRRFSGDQFGNFESVAYLGEEKAYVMIVLSSRNREMYEKSQKAFKQLVGSYHYLGSDVKLPENDH